MDITIGILAGGQSKRMGTNKAFLPWGATSLLQNTLNEFGEYSDILLSTDGNDIYASFLSSENIRIIEDQVQGYGPMEGLRQVLKHAQNNFVFICATDMPYIKKELAPYLGQFICSDYDCYILRDEQRVHPLCGIYSKAVLPLLEKEMAKGNHTLRHLLGQTRTKYISLQYSCFDAKTVLNVNRSEDYHNLFKPPVFCVSGIKNSGKTTLICRLIKELQPYTNRIAVIKHDGHDFQMDHAHTDTYRYAQSGAKHIAIYSPNKWASLNYAAIDIEALISLHQQMDVIIIEGLKESKYPKIEIVRAAVSTHTVCPPESTVALVTDMENNGFHGPVFHLDDITGLARYLAQHFRLSMPDK